MSEEKPQAEERRGSKLAEELASDEDAAVLGIQTYNPLPLNQSLMCHLAKLGYKQELRRNFSALEVFGKRHDP